MPTIREFVVRPALPPSLAALDRLARNLWWCWNHAGVELFKRLDQATWDEVGHSPLALLSRVSQERLDEAAADPSFVADLHVADTALGAYLGASDTWFAAHAEQPPAAGATFPAQAWPHQRIAYFSAEFGLTESVQIYSGGLGILAGDHLKSASDLGLPLVGVGLLYHEAFHQHLNADGYQQETHPVADLNLLPIALQKNAEGQPVKIRVDLPGRALHAQIWRLDVGRVPLFLLDSNLPENTPEDQRLTDRLYGGDLDMRIRQELLLGIGGLRALDAVGLRPAVVHMNEGHAAFSAIERVRVLIRERGLSFAEARELASAGNVFTTHTPVPAGNDRFPPEMVDRYLSDWYQGLGIGRDEFLALGREERTDPHEHFCMTVLALKLASKSNGVAQLHGHVSRKMWKRVYPGVPAHEVPIGAITNGVHQRSFLTSELRQVYDAHLGSKWVTQPEDPESWAGVANIPDGELWGAHEQARARAVSFARERLGQQLARRGAGMRELERAREVLDPKAFTIGFARRFATYKRATLILRDPARLAKVLNDADRPVQILFSGKAHQKDEAGKELIRKVVQLANQPEFRNKIVFLEDYDINVARHMVQGVDVWLNTPLRPLEASGTSGMKAVVNGAIHVSILDGWWAEAYDPSVGWAIGEAVDYADKELAEKVEAEWLYRQLEHEIVPRFYDRGADGLPHEWIRMMKASIRKLAPFFNTQRMVREYFETAYRPASTRLHAFGDGREARARALAQFRARVRKEWNRVAVRSVSGSVGELVVGGRLEVKARVALGELSPAEVDVQFVHAPLNANGELIDGEAVSMQPAGKHGDEWLFEGSTAPRRSGRFGYTVRIVAKHADLATPFDVVAPAWG